MPGSITVAQVELSQPGVLEVVSRLLAAYLWQTEQEKREHGGHPEPLSSPLPVRYRQEIADPAAAFAAGDVFLAWHGESAAGLVVAMPVGPAVVEIKRLWVEPTARRSGLGSALIRAALRQAAGKGCDTVRLTVWEWRHGALGGYRRLGFVLAADPWDARPGLICLERSAVAELPL